MATEGSIGHGATFTWHAQLIGELTRIGAVDLTVGKVDATTLGTSDYYKEYVPGLIDPGDLEIEGLWDPDDVGQALIFTDLHLRATQTWLITFPAGVSSATCTGSGFLSKFTFGEATPEGLVTFSATIVVTAKPTLTA